MAAEANREVAHQLLAVEYPNDGRIGRYTISFRGNGGFGRCDFSSVLVGLHCTIIFSHKLKTL